jgi:hypothetical protein
VRVPDLGARRSRIKDAELADVLEICGRPTVLTIEKLISISNGTGRSDFANYQQDRRNRRAIPHRLEDAGCVPARNQDATDGLWRVQGRRQAVYAQSWWVQNCSRDVRRPNQAAVDHPFKRSLTSSGELKPAWINISG